MDIQRLSLGMLQTNCYIVKLDGRDDAVVIDPAGEEEKIYEALGGRKPVVLLTHGHFDHTNALEAFKDADIYMHPADVYMLDNPDMNVGGRFGDIRPRPAPSVLVEDGDTFSAAGIPFSVIHTPGHTAGCVCYVTGDVMFSGDTLFRRAYGRTDHPGGDFGALRQSLRKLFALPVNYTVYPGHGGSTKLFTEAGKE